jgi:hypothetical protein
LPDIIANAPRRSRESVAADVSFGASTRYACRRTMPAVAVHFPDESCTPWRKRSTSSTPIWRTTIHPKVTVESSA